MKELPGDGQRADHGIWPYAFEGELAATGELLLKTADLELITRLGFPGDESLGPEGWMKAIFPEDIAGSAEAVEVLAQGRVWEGRVRMETVTHETLFLDVRVRPTRLEGGSVWVCVDARDITDVARLETALAEAQGRLRLVDSVLALGMWTTDKGLRFTRSSGSILGEDDSLVGTSLYEYFGSGDVDIPPIAAHLDALAGHCSILDVEWEGRDIRVLLEPFRNELGEIAGVSGIGLDLNVLLRVARQRGETQVTRVQHDRVHPAPIPESARTVSINGIVIDADRFEVRKNGQAISLSVTEFKLLTEFARNPGLVLSREILAERVWGHPWYADSPAVTMAVSRLREKIEEDPADPTLIQTVRGIGYRFADGDSAA